MKKLWVLMLTTLFVFAIVGTALSEPGNSSPDTTVKAWEGVRTRDPDTFHTAILKITPDTNSSFKFEIQAFSGSHTNGVFGIAQITGDTAVFDNGKGGILKFKLSDGKIFIDQSEEMYKQSGRDTVFNGEFNKKSEQKTAVVNENYFTEQHVFKNNQEEEFRRIVGDNYIKFKDTAQIFYEQKDLDGYEARVYKLNVRGLGAIMESIIMVRDSDNAIWAAVIDRDKVLYFTNTNETKQVPLTISRWHDRLNNKPIYYIPPSK